MQKIRVKLKSKIHNVLRVTIDTSSNLLRLDTEAATIFVCSRLAKVEQLVTKIELFALNLVWLNKLTVSHDRNDMHKAFLDYRLLSKSMIVESDLICG